MAYNNDSGGIGILGVLVGALIVIVLGAGLLFYSGQLGGGGDSATVNIDGSKATTGTSGGSSGGASKSAPSTPAPSGGSKQ